MHYLKAFMSGITFPSIILPIGIAFAIGYGRPDLLTKPIFHFIPIIWGLWNVLYYAFFKYFIPGGSKVSLFITGFLLGIFIAGYGVYELNIQELLGLPLEYKYAPLFVGPILYGLVWVYIVNYFNDVLGLNDNTRIIGF